MLSKKDISLLEKVGTAEDDSEIFHLQTKGGLHKILKKQKSGKYIILGQGGHRGIAKFLADQSEKNIKWHETLYKSEDAVASKSTDLNLSTPQNHIAQATWHTYMYANGDTLNKIYHSLQAIAHLQAAGMDKSKALETANKILKKLSKSEKTRLSMPHDEDLLRLAWERKHSKPFPSGE